MLWSLEEISDLCKPAVRVRFQVLMAVSMEMIAFRDIAPCSLTEED
jgi:hypothetical protein